MENPDIAPYFYGSNNRNPKELDDIIQNRDVIWDHLVWISKRECEESDIRFAWVYTHELQHLKQYQKNSYILILADFFWKAYLEIPKYMDFLRLDIPTEYECEFKAEEMVEEKLKDIFDKNECEEYKRKRIKNNNRYMQRFLDLKKRLGAIDIEEQMIKLICDCKSEFKKLQNNHFINNSFDFEKLCCYTDDPHTAIIESYMLCPSG